MLQRPNAQTPNKTTYDRVSLHSATCIFDGIPEENLNQYPGHFPGREIVPGKERKGGEEA